MQPIVLAQNLIKKYKALTAVDGIHFEVNESEFYGLIGPNGAGKTTTMKMIYGYSPRTSGKLEVLGMDPDLQPDKIKYHLGIIPQEINLDTELNVLENLTCYGRYFDLPKEKAKAKAKELLAFVQLSEKQNAQIEELSSGMKRRLLIARGLINDPKLLILDEPTVGLDPQARHLIWEKLFELKKQKVSLILTTHYMEEAQQLCDRVAIMDQGKILIIGKPQALITEQIGHEVIEIPSTEKSIDQIQKDLNGLQFNLEKTHHKIYLYTQDGQPILNRLVQKGYKNLLRRPATLEDVFLKFTGRQLND